MMDIGEGTDSKPYWKTADIYQVRYNEDRQRYTKQSKHAIKVQFFLCKPNKTYLLDFFCSGIQFYLLLSPYLCFISLLYLDLYVLRDDALIS